ncbi:MAG: NUDIX hydrolase [Pseudomonadota bacterium]
MTTRANDAATNEETHWPRPAASIAVFRDDSILLGRRGKPPLVGAWSLPGGKIEPGETAADAALRELDEETGVRADLLGVVGIRDVIIRSETGKLTAHYVIAVHAARWRAGEPVAASDITEARFVPLTDLDAHDLTDGAKALIADARRRFGLS